MSYNLFKKHFGNRLYGIDPANNKADQVIAWEDYKLHKKFNVFFVLGSINFGDEKYVESQIAKLSRETKTGDRVYWRQNPGTGDHPWKGVEEVQFYPWSFEKNEEWCNKYNFKLHEIKQDSGNRIYAEWIRL